MKRLLLAIALASLAVTPTLAQNKGPTDTRRAKKPAKTRTVKKAVVECADKTRPDCAKVIDFGKGDRVDGGRPTGDGDAITAVTGGRFGSLIRVRTSFVNQILKSAEGI